MTHVSIGKNFVNISILKDGSNVDQNNELLKSYDKDGNSIFSKAELQEIQKDLSEASGENQKLEDEEAYKFIAKRLNISVEDAKAKYPNLVNDAVNNLLGQYEGEKIAEKLWKLIDGFVFKSVEQSEFQYQLKSINKDNILYVLAEYKKASKNSETLIAGIWAEKTASEQSRKDAVSKLFNVLYGAVDGSKYDKVSLKAQFDDLMNQDFKDISLNKLDAVFKALTSMVEGKYVEGEADLNTATKNAQSRNKEALNTVDNQVDSQGAISRGLDNRRGRRDAGLTEETVKEIIANHDGKLKELEALKGDYKAYCAKFKEIFGVEYSRDAVENYNKYNNKYEKAVVDYQKEQAFNKHFENELKNPYIMYQNGQGSTNFKAQADLAYKGLYEKFAKFFGEEYTNVLIELGGLKDASSDEKYKFLTSQIKVYSDSLNAKTKEACGGISFTELTEKRNGAFNAAYGVQNDTYLQALDWITAQQKDLMVVNVGTTVALTALSFAGGPAAIAAAAAIVTNPVSFVEMATDESGMSAEDWKNFSKNCLTNIGWMALGCGAGKVGQLLNDKVKLMGLARILSKTGQSVDDLLKNKNLPADIAKSIQKYRMLGNAVGVTTEVAIDISTTALLQKEGATEGDWIMSIASALVGTALQTKLLSKSADESVSIIKQCFPDLNMSDAQARKVLETLVAKSEARSAAANSMSSRYMPSGNIYSSIVPINPAWIDKLGGFIKNLFSSGTDKLFEPQAQKYINKLDPDMKNAFDEAFADITARLCDGELPNNKMLDEVCTSFADKHGIDCDDLKDNLIAILENDKKWENIAELFELRKAAYNNSGTKESAKALIAELRVSKGMYSQEHEKAILKMFSEVETRVLSGEVPSKNMLDDVAQKYSKEFGVDAEELMYSLLERSRNDESWSKIGFYLGKESSEINSSWRENAVAEFKKAKGGEDTKSIKSEDVKSDNGASEPTKTEANSSQKQKFEVTDELYEKYSYIYDKTFYDSDSRAKIIEVMENYEKAVAEGKISPDNFDEMLIYKLLDEAEISSNDVDRCTNLIKEKFHQKVIAYEAKVKNIKEKYGIYDEEVIKDADKVFDIIREKKDNGQKITQDELESIIYNDISDKRLVDRVLKYVCSDDADIELKNYIEDCTHYSVYNDKSYGLYSDDAKAEAVSAFDKLYASVKSSSELTNDLISSYSVNLFNWGAEDLFLKLIHSHHELGPMYNILSR